MPIQRRKVYLQKQYQRTLGEKHEKRIKLVACTASLATPTKGGFQLQMTVSPLLEEAQHHIHL